MSKSSGSRLSPNCSAASAGLHHQAHLSLSLTYKLYVLHGCMFYRKQCPASAPLVTEFNLHLCYTIHMHDMVLVLCVATVRVAAQSCL